MQPWYMPTSSIPTVRMARMKRRVAALAVAVVPLVLGACGGGASAPAAPPAPTPVTPPVTPAAPTIAAQPAPAAVQAGEAASFTVVATGSGPLSYQWYRSGTALSGATAASYTTPTLSVADNGATFSVSVTGSGGTITSTSVTLSVAAAPVGAAPKVVKLSVAGSGFALAVRADGSAIQWGLGAEGGAGTAIAGTTAKLIAGVSNAVAVSAQSVDSGGGTRSLVVTGDGYVWGWGRNGRGALGVTYTGDDKLIVNAAVRVTQLSAAIQTMACLADITYALRADGSVWLLPGERSGGGVVSAARLNGLPAIDQLVQAEAGIGACVLLAIASDGSVWRASTRESDYDPTLQRYTMLSTVEQDTIAPPQVSQVSCTDASFDPRTVHCLAVTRDGKLWAWGVNHSGQLGLGDTVSRTLATVVTGVAGIKKVLAAVGLSYALANTGELYVWGGFNGDSMVGGRTGSATVGYSDFWRPGLVPSIRDIDDFAVAPYGGFVTALKKDGTIWSWGQNKRGVFGDGTSDNDTGVPTQALGLSLK